MSKFSKGAQHIVWLPAKDISIVWATAQRGLDERKVKMLVKEFDPDAFGSVVVTKPDDKGIYHCVDGQHRHRAVVLALGAEQLVPCIIVDASTPERAADIWMKINTARTKPSAIDCFRVGVTAGYEAEVAVNRILLELGYRVSGTGAEGTVRAVAACLAIHKRYGGESLTNALAVIKSTWGRESVATDAYILRGVAQFLDKHKEEVDRERLAEQLAKKYTPQRLLGAAKSAREIQRGGVADAVCACIATTYNGRLRQRRLKEAA